MDSEPERPAADGWEIAPAGPAADEWSHVFGGDESSLLDLVNRVLDKGVVITGEVTISVAGVDLVYLGLNAVLTSVSTARLSLGRTGLLAERPPHAPDAP